MPLARLFPTGAFDADHWQAMYLFELALALFCLVGVRALPLPPVERVRSFERLDFITFPLFAKVEVNGPQAHPLFVQLKRRAPGLLGSQVIKWNFTKFLVSGDGKSVKRYAPTTKPEALKADIEALLG